MKSLLLLSILTIALSIVPSAHAQDQDNDDLDTPSIIPNPNQSNTPPIIMDESDSNEVEEVEEYEN